MVAKKKVAKSAVTNDSGSPAGTQATLPRGRQSGADLTTEFCNLEVQLRRRKGELEKAQASLELAKGAVKSAEGEVQQVQDAIAEALYDLRSGQGRITFPEAGEVA
jgi:multidrug resistance efflux pump